MSKKISIVRTAILSVVLIISAGNPVYCQGGFDNSTRALYIFDLAKYIDYGPGFTDSADYRLAYLLGIIIRLMRAY